MIAKTFYFCFMFFPIFFYKGIIPGPHEPKEHINTFLKPLVDDLLLLWEGVLLSPGGEHTVRAALMAVTTDIPALRKVTQFLGHKADLGGSVNSWQNVNQGLQEPREK